MAQEGLFHPPADFVKKAHIKSFEQYKQMYDRSIKDPDGFWGEIAEKNFY
jgi:acetyl-CoA synthetase